MPGQGYQGGREGHTPHSREQGASLDEKAQAGGGQDRLHQDQLHHVQVELQ